MKQIITHFAVALDNFIVFFTINLPVNIIFPLSVVYGVMEACLYYVFMHVHICMYECMDECMYTFVCVCIYACMYACMYPCIHI